MVFQPPERVKGLVYIEKGDGDVIQSILTWKRHTVAAVLGDSVTVEDVPVERDHKR